MSDAAPPGSLSTEQLFREHAAFVTRFLTRMGVPAAQLEDALQEVFLVVHRNGGYRPGLAKPTSYLGNIAIHAARAQRRRQGVARARYTETGVDELAAHGGDPNRALESQEDLQRLQAALDRLPDELRTPLVLADLEGESGLSIAAALGLPLGTVYWRLHEARKKFRHALKVVDSQPMSAVVSPRSESKRGSRAASLGMLMFTAGSSNNTEVARLLRLGRDQSSVQPAVERLLADHKQLVQSGAPLPPWAATFAPRTANWLTLSGATTFPGLLVIALGTLGIVLLTLRAPPVPKPLTAVRPQAVAAKRSATPAVVELQIAPEVADPRAALPRAEPKAPRVVARLGASRGVARPHAVASRADANAAPTVAAISGADDLPPSAAPGDRTSAHETAAAPEHPRAEPDAQPTQPTARGTSEAALEIQALAQAESWLDTQPARALAATRAMTTRFPSGYFHEERSYVQVMALFALGRVADARVLATAFLRHYPDGPYSRLVRARAATSTTSAP